MFKIQEGFQIDHVDQGFGVFVDPRDNKEYPYKTFGTQVWMLKDLDYGTRVNVPTSPKGSEMTQTEGTCYKAKDNNNYGNWTEGRAGIYLLPSLSWVAPPGWHVPTLDEWATLQNWMKTKYGTSNYNPAKAMLGTTHWVVNSFTPTNDSGFGLLPQGMFEKGWTATGSGSWSYVETSGMTQGRWWTSSSNSEGVNYVVQFYNSSSTYSQTNGYYKTGYNVTGLPVRLIKDTPAASTEPEIESISITIPSSGASDSKLVTEKAVKDYVDSQAGGSISLDSTDEVTVSGSGTQADPYTFNLTGKLQSTEDVDIIAARDANVSFGRSMAVGSSSSYNLTMETGNLMSLTASNELDLTGSTILKQISGTQIYATAPYEYHYNSNRFAVAQSNQAGAKNIQFDGSLSEDISNKTVNASGYMSETAAGPLSIVSSGATAAFKGAGPTTIESTGGAAVTVSSTGNNSIVLNSTGISLTSQSLPISVSTNDLRLQSYAKAYDSTDTHKILTRADTTGSIELASTSDLTLDGPVGVNLSGECQHQLSYKTGNYSLYILDGDDPTDSYNWKPVSPFFIDYDDSRKTKLISQVTDTVDLGNSCSIVAGSSNSITINASNFISISTSSTTVSLDPGGLTIVGSLATTSVSPGGFTVTAPNGGNPLTSTIDPAMVSTSSILAASASAPSNPSAGQMYYDTTLSTLRIYKNSAWEPVCVEPPNVVSSNYVLTSQSGVLKWEKTPDYYPQKTQYNILPNQCAGYITTTLDRVYLFHMYGSIGITKPEFIRTILYENGGTGAEFYAYIWRQSDKVMTHYGHLTLSSNTRNVRIPLTQLDTFDPESYWYGIVIHSNGTGNPRFLKGDFLSSSNYIDGAFSYGDAIPAEQNLQSSTTGPSVAIVGR